MKLKSLSTEEIEEKSYGELTEIILAEKGTKMKIVDVFKKICDLKGMSDAEFENTVADFFELVSTDKKFVVLDKGYCDLKIKHNQKVVIDDDDEEETIEPDEIESVEEQEETEETEDEDIFYDNSSDEDDVNDDDDELADFIVVDEEESNM